MKSKGFLAALVCSALFFNLKAQSEMDSLSYSLGILLAQNLKSQGFNELDLNSLSKGMDDFIKGGELLINTADAQQIVQEYAQTQQAKKFEGAIAEGKKFLEENAGREGVVTLPSGLQYEVITAGEGPKPKPSEKVSVHYHGTLIDGTVFDSSVQRGQPAVFGVTQVIQGWQEALQLMPVGSKWKLFIPYDLAYGERGAGGKIGPFSTLIFEVELLEIKE
jgi:FKBP-type peptidyl-prolyl cis-trans isomerase FklB